MISPKMYNLEERTFEFAQQVRMFVKSLPRTIADIEDWKQVIRLLVLLEQII